VTSPPTGTVTFLFTDIEGSTRLWERDASAMHSALARHDGILRSAIEERDGHVFKTVGDAFCAAFSSAPEALGAAISAQRALHDEEWEEAATIRTAGFCPCRASCLPSLLCGLNPGLDDAAIVLEPGIDARLWISGVVDVGLHLVDLLLV
jgi:hypothetical protein